MDGWMDGWKDGYVCCFFLNYFIYRERTIMNVCMSERTYMSRVSVPYAQKDPRFLLKKE